MQNQNRKNSYKIIPIANTEENNMIINHECYNTLFGNVFVASTDKGICFIGIGDEKEMLEELKKRFNNITSVKNADNQHKAAIAQINNPESVNIITFHVKGTEFQLKVWNELLNIPLGKTCSYKEIAESIGNPKAARAVGTAVGQNPIAFLIPCHRVIRSDGEAGGYYWGTEIKQKILKHELAH